MKGHIYRWVIQSDKPQSYFLNAKKYPAYSVKRRSYKSKNHLRVGMLVDARKFKTKNEAEKYFYKRVNSGGNMEWLVIRRKKFFHEGKYLLYFENIRR